MSAFGFSIPALLLVIPCAIAFLLYVYRKRGHADAIVVSTLLLLRNLKEQVQVRKKVFPPPRFFFELLLLFGLIFAAAGLYKLQGDGNVVVLIDNSLSMAAGNKMSDAKTAAKQSFYNKNVNLFVTSPHLKSVTDGAVSASEAETALERIETAYSADNLDTALAELSKKYKNIVVISDKGGKSTSNITLKTVTLRGKNVAILGISKNGSNVDVLVRSFSHGTENVKVDGYYWVDEGLEIVKRKLDSKTESIAPSMSKTIKFNIPKGARAFLAEASYNQAFDSLAEDNKAWLALDDSSSNVVVVSAVSNLGLEKIPNLNFKYITPEKYDAELDLIKKAKFIIFHRVAPAKMPDRASLIVKPDSGNEFFELSGDIIKTAATSYNKAHSLMRYLNPHTLGTFELQPLKSMTLEPVLSTAFGVALLAGDVKGKKAVVSGIELFPYEGKNSPFMTVLTLNIFDYLSDNVLDGYAAVYSSLPDAGAKYLDGALAKQPLERQIQASGLIQSDGNLIAANYFNEQESDVLKSDAVTVPEGGIVQEAQDSEKTPLAQTLLLAVFIFLTLDSLYFLYKRV